MLGENGADKRKSQSIIILMMPWGKMPTRENPSAHILVSSRALAPRPSPVANANDDQRTPAIGAARPDLAHKTQNISESRNARSTVGRHPTGDPRAP